VEQDQKKRAKLRKIGDSAGESAFDTILDR
jgi:hypothetical protein